MSLKAAQKTILSAWYQTKLGVSKFLVHSPMAYNSILRRGEESNKLSEIILHYLRLKKRFLKFSIEWRIQVSLFPGKDRKANYWSLCTLYKVQYIVHIYIVPCTVYTFYVILFNEHYALCGIESFIKHCT